MRLHIIKNKSNYHWARIMIAEAAVKIKKDTIVLKTITLYQ